MNKEKCKTCGNPFPVINLNNDGLCRICAKPNTPADEPKNCEDCMMNTICTKYDKDDKKATGKCPDCAPEPVQPEPVRLFVKDANSFTEPARTAFLEREKQLRKKRKWPNTRWYDDRDFCEVYNEALTRIGELNQGIIDRDSSIFKRGRRITELEGALEKYGQHLSHPCCRVKYSRCGAVCTCGLRKILKGK